MRLAVLPLMLSAAVLGASVAHASEAPLPTATLSGIQGTVLVNQGDQFVNTSSATVLAAGDRVLLMSGASARLEWSDGCVVELQPEAMVSIDGVSPCAGTPANITALGPMTAQAIGDTGVSADEEAVAPVAPGTEATRDNDSESYTWLIVGGVGLGLVLAASGGGGSSSPAAAAAAGQSLSRRARAR